MFQNVIRATINGELREFTGGGMSILDAARSAGIDIPTLCHDPRLKPIGGCRLCLVQVEGWPHPVTSCNSSLADGMTILTHTPALERERASLLRMLAQDHPADVFSRFPDKEFHRRASQYGLTEADFDGGHRAELLDDSHPYIHVDMSQCILCYRCVRICAEVQGQFVWEIVNRGHETRIVPDWQTNLRESSCVSCGACVDSCPTGALEDKSILAHGLPTRWTRTTCPYCGTGCEMNVGTKENRLASIVPVLDAPVSRGHLCVKGRYAFDFVSASDRISDPMIRKNGEWQPVSWDEAHRFVATGLQRIIKEYGPDSVGVLGSARATNEENYLVQKLARTVIGTNNVDCCARVCHAPSAAALKLMLGTGAGTNSYDDIEQARTILIFGTNTTENHPIVGARIKLAALNGAKLIVIDPREIELARYATIHLQPHPGTNVPLLNALAYTIIEEGLYDDAFLQERVTEFSEFWEFIKDFSPELMTDTCRVEAKLIRNAARLYANEKPAVCFHGLGVTEHTQGTEGAMCLVNLALLTGNLGRPGTGINPLRGQNNVQGAAHMGCDPGVLTGSVPLNDGKDLFESVWHAPIPNRHGLNLMEMMDAAADGKLKALWAIGYDILLTNPNANATERALRSLELVIVQDMFLNQTARFASVFLPACSSFEKDGTFMNAERRIQRIRKVLEPVGQSKSDWEIICALAKAMGKEDFFKYSSPQDTWNEIRAVWRAGSGITYARIEHGGLQWPCPTEDHPGTKLLHSESFPVGKKAALRRIAYRPTAETTNQEFPFLLITGRRLYQFNAATMTGRTLNNDFQANDFLDICQHDADRLCVHDGEHVRIRSRSGEAIMPIRITQSVRSGELFTTFHTGEVFLNRLTSPYRDDRVKTPEYKVTAVRIDKQ
jgi:formate dehydrogenase major subunit